MKGKKIDVQGAVTYWGLAKWTDHDSLEQAMTALGLEDHIPDPPTPDAACKTALKLACGARRRLVRPLADTGYALVNEDADGDDLDYGIELRAIPVEINGAPALHLDPADHDRADDLQRAYVEQRTRLNATRVGHMLANLAEHLGGVRLRERGGVYWLPEKALAKWQQVAAAVEDAAIQTTSSLYLLRTQMDENTLRAVRDAITLDIEEEAEKIRLKIADRERAGALERLQNRAVALEQRIADYEKILGEPLESLRETQELAQSEAAMAVLAAMGGDDE